MDYNKIGKFIASRRKELGLTQQNLADKLFVTDKAISKWERGLSLPDVSLLGELAKILEVDIADVLDGKKGTNRKINVEEEIERVTKELTLIHKKKRKKFIIFLLILLLVIIYILFRNLSLGYDSKNVNYSHSNRNINIGVPKTSFMMKHNDRSYSYKNLRNSNIVENELKKYLKTLKYSTCNDTIYYYDEKDNFSVISYSVKNHVLYNTISYEIVNGDYCFSEKLDEYSIKLDGSMRYHIFGDPTTKFGEEDDEKITILFLDKVSIDEQKFNATMNVTYSKKVGKEINTYILEDSLGEYEIKDNKLYYYRKEIKEQLNDIKIPEVSTFTIEDGKLILVDNYLSDYYSEEIILR